MLGSKTADYISDIKSGKDENVYFVGETFGDFEGNDNKGIYDAFIGSLDTNGNNQWIKTISTSNYEGAYSLAIGQDGIIHVSGATHGENPKTELGGIFVSKFNLNGESNNLNYSWQISNDQNNWREVSSASTYKITPADEGNFIRNVISYEDGQGFDETVPTSSINIPYVNNGKASFSINGNATVGNTLTINQDAADPDGMELYLTAGKHPAMIITGVK